MRVGERTGIDAARLAGTSRLVAKIDSAAAADRGPQDFADLLLTPGVGARTVAALAFVAEVIHGTPSRFTDRHVSHSRTGVRTGIRSRYLLRCTTRLCACLRGR
jgi:hypothetical protein